jgi:hypothetical protein
VSVIGGVGGWRSRVETKSRTLNVSSQPPLRIITQKGHSGAATAAAAGASPCCWSGASAAAGAGGEEEEGEGSPAIALSVRSFSETLREEFVRRSIVAVPIDRAV